MDNRQIIRQKFSVVIILLFIIIIVTATIIFWMLSGVGEEKIFAVTKKNFYICI